MELLKWQLEQILGIQGHKLLPLVEIEFTDMQKTSGGAQCVESELRWQFCVHGSTCPEIYF